MQQAEGLYEGATTEESADVEIERRNATLYTKRWIQESKKSRVHTNTTSNTPDDESVTRGDLELPASDSFGEDEFNKYALVTARTKHFYKLDKKKLVGRHADEGGIWALRDLSLALEYGECFGLLGPNGAG